jgi:multiple sugar transport system ATP-binding protein
VLQQLDTPQNLFRHPANLFVAAFIGSPSMNLVDAYVVDGSVRFAGRELALPDGSRLAGEDRRVILGIRPTDFEHGRSALAEAPRMRVHADVVEDLGSEYHVVFTIDAPRVSAEAVRAAAEAAADDEGKLFADDQRAVFTACVDTRHAAAAGTEVELAVDNTRFHFFDPGTGNSLDVRRRAAVTA